MSFFYTFFIYQVENLSGNFLIVNSHSKSLFIGIWDINFYFYVSSNNTSVWLRSHCIS